MQKPQQPQPKATIKIINQVLELSGSDSDFSARSSGLPDSTLFSVFVSVFVSGLFLAGGSVGVGSARFFVTAGSNFYLHLPETSSKPASQTLHSSCSSQRVQPFSHFSDSSFSCLSERPILPAHLFFKATYAKNIRSIAKLTYTTLEISDQ